MFWNRYFTPSVVVMLVVVSLHWLASFEGFYWTVWWYDVMMHFLGGLWTLLFGLWVFGASVRTSRLITVRNMLIFALAVGLLWEVHEIILGFASFDHPEYWTDTPQDLVLDMLGAIFGVLIYKKSITNRQ
jgi:hypothetical protein